jgi:ABC-type Fe3+/spermidine/putrescine transport system ATPase subunit
MIALDHVSLFLGTTGLRDISLAFQPGTWTFVIGPSGAGKTLLLETLAGLHAPDSGRVLLGDRDAAGISPESRGVALVYQDSSLFPHMTVTENILFGLEQRNLPAADRHKQADALIGQFRLGPLKDRYPATLSGGERQRVAIARALAVQPSVLLLDEPFGALDPLTRQEHILMMQQIRQERRLTVVQVSHSRDEAFALADQVAVLIEGKLVQSGTCDEVFFNPATTGVARFSGIENILPGKIVRSNNGMIAVEVCGLVVREVRGLLPGTSATICIRGTDVSICRAPESPPAPGRIRLNGVISAITPLEHTLRVVVSGPFPIIAMLARDEVARSLAVGQAVLLEIDAAAVRVIPSEEEPEP